MLVFGTVGGKRANPGSTSVCLAYKHVEGQTLSGRAPGAVHVLLCQVHPILLKVNTLSLLITTSPAD